MSALTDMTPGNSPNDQPPDETIPVAGQPASTAPANTQPDAATIDLAEAKRIVAGGAGLGSPEVMATLPRVAAALGCATGATRGLSDAGWVPFSRQIGTTGVVVEPDLYVAFGISGAVQHVSGIGSPRGLNIIGYVGRTPIDTLAHGMTPQQAVESPNFVHRNGPTILERGHPAATLAALTARAAQAGAVVVATDLPSGVDADTGVVAGVGVRADVTVTFGTIKPGLLIDPGASHAGTVQLVDIGLGPHLPAAPAVTAPSVMNWRRGGSVTRRLAVLAGSGLAGSGLAGSGLEPALVGGGEAGLLLRVTPPRPPAHPQGGGGPRPASGSTPEISGTRGPDPAARR